MKLNMVQRGIMAGAVALIMITAVINPPMLIVKEPNRVVMRADYRASMSRTLGIAVAACLACLSVRGYAREKGPLEDLI